MPPCLIISANYSAVHQAFNAWDDDSDAPHALNPTHWMLIALPKGGYGDD